MTKRKKSITLRKSISKRKKKITRKSISKRKKKSNKKKKKSNKKKKQINGGVSNEDLRDFIRAIIKGDFKKVEALLIDKNLNINAVYIGSPSGFTPIFYAVLKKNKKIVKLLLDKGADPNIKAFDGSTLLMISAVNGSTSIAKLFINKIDVNAKNDASFTALNRAVTFNNISMVKLLLQNGADPNISSFGVPPLEETPLELSIRLEHEEIRNLLLSSQIG
jgi:ankyrin repeat protein